MSFCEWRGRLVRSRLKKVRGYSGARGLPRMVFCKFVGPGQIPEDGACTQMNIRECILRSFGPAGNQFWLRPS